MSSLAFDKQGKPFAFQRRTRKLLVRLFRNPSARGTCCQVLGTDGQPLYVDPETDYVEFRKAVGQVPGLYRLDQCDDAGNELDDAQPAYVSIDVTRNAQTGDATGDVSPLLIIQQMAATQADVMKAMAAQQAALLAATAEILRAPYRPAPVAMPAPELRNTDASAENDDDRDDDDSDEEVAPEHPATAALRMIEPHLPQLGGFLYEKFAEFLRHIYSKKSATPAATPTPVSVPATAPTAPQPTGAPVSVAAGWGAGTAPVSASSCVIDTYATETSATDTEAVAQAEDAEPELEAPTPAAPQTSIANPAVAATTDTTQPSVPPVPTREQFAHLYAIRERLSAKERAIAENAISRMDPPMLARWLAELSAMSVDHATNLIRGMVAKLQPPRGSKSR